MGACINQYGPQTCLLLPAGAKGSRLPPSTHHALTPPPSQREGPAGLEDPPQHFQLEEPQGVHHPPG